MEKSQIIILILGLLAGAEFILFIVYISKYYSLRKDYNALNKSCINNTSNTSPSTYMPQVTPNSINETGSQSNTTIIDEKNKTSNNTITYKDIYEIINTYDIYNNMDFNNKYDLLDQFGEKIAIYSLNLNNCYLTCELLTNCYGFARFHNYCYLKTQYNLTDKMEFPNVELIIKQNKSENISNNNLFNDNKIYSELNNN